MEEGRKRRTGVASSPREGEGKACTERERVDLESGVKDGVKMEGEKYEWDGVTGIPTPDIRSTLLLGRSSGNSRWWRDSISKFRIPEARAANFLRSIIHVPLAWRGIAFSRVIYKWKLPYGDPSFLPTIFLPTRLKN